MARRNKDDFGFLSHLDELIEELHHNVSKALHDFDADAIHDARVATRRLKAALDLLQFVLSDDNRKPLAKVLKKLRRRLGPLRDADVMIDHLRELTPHPKYGKAADWLRDHLTRGRDKAQTDSGQKTSPADVLARLGAWWDVRRGIVEAREAIDSLLAESLHLQLDAFVERADAIGNQSNSTDGSERRQDPHLLRIAGKLLRYTLELATAQGHKLPASVMRSFKKMQEALGDWHDWVVLIECAADTASRESLAYHDLTMQEDVLDLSRLFVRRASRQLDQFARLWQRQGGHVAATIREKFPLTRSLSEPQTGPGPSGSDGTPAPVALPPDVASTA